MNTNNITNRMKEMENRLAELAKLLRRKNLYAVEECISMYEFMHGNVKEAKVVQSDYGFSMAVTRVTHFTVTPDDKIIEHKCQTFYYPLYKNYEGLYDGKVISKDDLFKMYMLILTRPGYPVLFRVSLTPEEGVKDITDYASLQEEYHKLFAEYLALAEENGMKYNIFAGLILY